MAKNIKYGKVTIVVLITILIWVWADLAQDDTFTVPNVTISIAKSTDPGLWVSFDEESSVSIENVVLEGPASKIADVERGLRSGSLSFVFFLDPAQEETMTAPGRHSLDVQGFLRKSALIKERALTVESSSPKSIPVNIVKLEKKWLKVRCVDENGITRKNATIDPPQVEMFVLEDWEGEQLIADVRLTLTEIAQARTQPIKKTPQIQLAPRQIRKALNTVKIKMPPEENPLSERTITAANLMVALSVNLQGKYRVEVTNHPEVVRPFTIRATLEAEQAYERQPFQMTLYILDGDEKVEGEQKKPVIYNLPEEFVRNDQIMPPTLPVQAKFKLIFLPPGEGPPAAGS